MEESWRIQMGVYNLTDGANQPFYNVLADDGSCRYASQGLYKFLWIYLFDFFPCMLKITDRRNERKKKRRNELLNEERQE